ncbi:MAG: type 3 dihydrofolate reductase [Gammaproteobacteria bacterium]|nr:type 3 dihydrofolate reductase [Gammaproteobacteria bacterium]
MVSIIAAMDRNRLIGSNNQLPWHLPADLAHFKQVTMGKPVIMGRKTYESIGRPLPGRTNIVLTRSSDFQPEGVVVVPGLEQALGHVAGAEEVMIIGGSSLYELALPMVDRLYLTFIENSHRGDAWFPDFDPTEWQVIASEEHRADTKNSSDYRFVTYQRK